ncbi:hypothetical protein PFLG_01571 [Plasmodium falciparum RAJ116]|uniref:RNA polymerase III subunit C3 n=1 Tax=Plasmodium falciparum RAJ116 TaxID=580058 RepID=A0A0L0CXK0_PLAFA|nr:hypothetical protein PFLG_01571 [Plasmodium falciparum RAJ116]
MIKNELDYLKYIICDIFGSCCSDIVEIILLYGNKLSIYELINLSSYEFNVVRNVLLCLLIHNIVDVNIIYSKSIECNHLSPEETRGVINVYDNNKMNQHSNNEMNQNSNNKMNQHCNNKMNQHCNNKMNQHSDNKNKYLFKVGIKKKNIISHHKHNEELKTIPDIKNEEMQSFNFLCNSKNYEYMKRCKCDSCICKIRRVEYFVIIKNIYVLVRYPSILYYIHPTSIIKDKKSITSLNNFSTTSSDLQLDINTYNFFNTEMIDEFEDVTNLCDDKNGDIIKNNNNNNNNHNHNNHNNNNHINNHNDDYLHNRNQIQDDTFFRNSNGLVEKNETLNFIKKIILIRIIKMVE